MVNCTQTPLNTIARSVRSDASLAICIVTPDILGPVKNGGIGTACTNLAYELLASGHCVSILYSAQRGHTQNDEAWVKDYRNDGISIAVLEEESEIGHQHFPNHSPLVMAYTVYLWLMKHENTASRFDAIIFMEWQGSGFYALHAKKAGLAFKDTALIVQIHSPSLWHSVNNAGLEGSTEQSITWHMERKCIELADAVTSPSAYMLEWCREQGYTIPFDSHVLQNFTKIRQDLIQTTKRCRRTISEIVFFGRLEYRKGLVQFCNAIEVLLQEGLDSFRVTFMGKPAWVGQEHALAFIGRRTKNWPLAVSIFTNLDHHQALQYLVSGAHLAVMPSVADNSPCTVCECLKAKIPFIARDVGGISELMSSASAKYCLVDDTPRSLAGKIGAALRDGWTCPEIAVDDEANRKKWSEFLAKIVQRTQKAHSPRTLFEENAQPLVSVCLTHYSRPRLLAQAVDSLRAQSYANIEVILADDGSPDKESQTYLQELQDEFDDRGWKILHLPNGYPGKARNEAVKVARGEWLLCFDDDNVATPEMVQKFLHAAQHAKTKLVTCVFSIFSGSLPPSSDTTIDDKFLSLGNILSWSTVNNAIGDTTSLIHRSVFQQLGGFTEDYGLGHEDFELLLKAVLAGYQIAIVPEILFWYRRNVSSIQQSTNAAANRMRSLRPFLQMLPPEMAEMAVLAHALAAQDTLFQQRRASAPAHLSLEAQDQFALRAPDSAESLCAVAENLIQGGQHQLAQQIMSSVQTMPEAESFETQPTNIITTASLALESKDWKTVRACVKQLVSSALPDQTKSRALSIVLEQLAHCKGSKAASLRVRICDSLSTVKDVSCKNLLVVSNCYLENNLIEKGLEIFRLALHTAEIEYFKIRSDVEDAVRQGQFACGLHHYTLHGKFDKTIWPCTDLFIDFLQIHFAIIESTYTQEPDTFFYLKEAFKK